MLNEATLYPNRPIAVNPIWERFAVVNLFIVLATVTAFTKRLGIPNEARAAFVNWLNMIKGELFKREFNITFQAVEVVELAKSKPFSIGIRPARLGFASAVDVIPFSEGLSAAFGLSILPPVLLVVLLAAFGLPILPLRLLKLFGLSIFPPSLPYLSRLFIFPLRLLVLFGLPIFPLRLLVLFGLAILLVLFGLAIFPMVFLLAYLALAIQSIFPRFIPMKFSGWLSLFALTTPFNHFAASSFISILKLYHAQGAGINGSV